MKQVACLAGTLALLAGAVLVLNSGGAVAKDPTIKEIMTRLHKGANAPLFRLKKELQAPQPDWGDVQKTTREFASLGAALEKDEPPRGGKESWAKLTREYAGSARTLDEAAQRKDKPAALAAQARLAGTCMACHKAHRPN
jgi:hypothetical protein